jgi:uncharacterized protein (TIGR02145 family)
MKKPLSILAFVLLLLSFYSCNKEQKDFTIAKQANTIETLKEFANNYPDGKYIDIAKEIIDKLVWDSVLRKDIICDYESFIDEHGKSKFVDSAKLMIEKQNTVKDVDNSVKDKDCNLYNTVKIGTQTWMAENLRTTKYKDGTSIPIVSDKDSWGKLNTPAFCWYDNNVKVHKNPDGALYNWYAVKIDKLCPKGWHVPTESEWAVLINYLGGSQNAGFKMKSSGDTWKMNNVESTNSSGFTGLPSGTRDPQGRFSNKGESSSWWSTTESENPDLAIGISLRSESANAAMNEQKKNGAFSVRCIED